MARKKPVPVEQVQRRILILRGQRVIIDADLAYLYGVTTKRLNEQVRRNKARFPSDFVFQLTWAESDLLRSHFATSNADTLWPNSTASNAVDLALATQIVSLNDPTLRSQFATSNGRGGRRYRPFAFTEHGVLMAANVLNSGQAVKASVFVARAFVKLRELLSTHHQLARKLDELERKLQNHDDQILSLVEAIRELMDEPEDPPKPPIGFHTEVASKQLKAKKG